MSAPLREGAEWNEVRFMDVPFLRPEEGPETRKPFDVSVEGFSNFIKSG